MAWNYIAAPQDGTVWLEWISSRNGEHRFPSDGYVWGDPEQAHRREFGGYSIEMMIHTVGYRPGFDQVASHARTRYHFIAKNPSVNAAPPDPSLWIVHYHQTDQHSMMPVNQLQITSPMRQILTERRWLEGQGRLERKDFMLHDREHWPTINVPGHAHLPPIQQSGMHSNPMMQQQMNQQRFPQHPYASAQGPPAKRQRHSGPNAMPGSSDGVHDTSLEDEENTSQGDFFDFLSPREISMARYMQHHRWMEEVFSSPYASSQIVPPDLGLGIMGELKGLTDGILPPPSIDELQKPQERPNKAKDAQPFTNLKKEQIDEFNRRVEKHLEEGRAEIERMKKEHAEKMAEWKKTKTLMQAEKRLRHATWEGHENAVPAFRLETPATNGHAEDGAPTETVEDVVKDVETVLGVKIESHKDATMIEKGGLEKDEEQSREEIAFDGGVADDQEMSGMQQQEAMMSSASHNGAATQSAYTQSLPPATETKAQALEQSIPTDLPQPSFEGQHTDHEQPDAANQVPPPVPDSMCQHDPLDNMGGVDEGENLFMEGMDMDVDTGDIDFIEHPEALGDESIGASGGPDVAADFSAQPDVQAPEGQSAGAATSAALGTSHTASPVTLGEAGEQQAPTPQQFPQQLPEEGTVSSEPAIDTTSIPQETAIADIGEHDPGLGGAGETGMFDDGTFDDLTNMDDGNGDDGLIDFDGGMGMEDSAFGDALHGMDTHTPLTGLDGGGDEEGGQGGS